MTGNGPRADGLESISIELILCSNQRLLKWYTQQTKAHSLNLTELIL